MSQTFVRFLSLLLTVPFTMTLWGGESKDDETFRKSVAVLQEAFTKQDVAQNLANARCILILPEVKKFGIGIGGSGGRGPMACRQGKNFDGPWSAPAFYSVSGASVGLQVGGSSTDFVLLVMNQKGVDALLKGKTKLGRDASVAAGSSGATASSVGDDILSYGKTSGLFAGASLGDATIEPDQSGNQRLYGKPTTPSEVLFNREVQTPPAAEPLISLLNSKVRKHKN